MRDLWRRFRKSKSGLVGLALVSLLFLSASLAPVVAPYHPEQLDLVGKYQAPSARHLLGTDEFGRDNLSRIIYGSRVVVTVAVSATALASVAGVSLGLMAGLNGGAVDAWIMRVVDVLLAFPGLILALALVAATGPSLANIVLVIGITRAPSFARLIRSMVLSVRERDFVEAARATGASKLRIALRHVLPNAMGPMLVYSTLSLGFSILTVSGLSFLGVGVQPPAADWGVMLTRGREYLLVAPWIPFYPGLAIFLTVMGFNLLGDGLRDALDPHSR